MSNIFQLDPGKLFNTLFYNFKEPLLFNSGFFLFWFLLFLIFHQIVHKNRNGKILYITVFSLYFLYKASGIYFLCLVFTSFVDFYLAHLIHQTEEKRKKKLYLILSLVSNFALLGYFKYTNFFISTLNSVGGFDFAFHNIFLPIGISFYTFQSLSYTLDVYRGELMPVKKYLDFCFCVSFFPHLVAGPIIRASTLIPQLEKEYFITRADFGKAIFLIIAGLIKKAIIADYISINFIDRIFDEPLRYSGIENLFAIYAYALQIYCDFSGYSDMAIGIALLIGFKLPVNFDSPYQSKSITEFWRRWHISLSSWLRDYLYISLGGNRKGKIRQYINLMLTMLLGGLWHGASWKFVLWGAWHGILLAIEKMFNVPAWVKKNIFTKVFGVIFTFHLVCFSWIFFRADSFEKAVQAIKQIMFNFDSQIFFQLISGYKEVFFLLILGFILHFAPKSMEAKMEGYITRTPLLAKAFLVVFVIWLVIQVKSSDIQPFIYFQF
jgi:alginate O-acetyltransferase complex protein AlgI